MKIVRPTVIDDATLASSNVSDTVAAWASGTTYAAAAVVYRLIDDVHQQFTSVQSSNTAHIPETDDGTWWTANGPTNRWAMFDRTVQTQTINIGSIAVELEPSGRVDTIALLNVAAAEITITLEDAVDGVFFDETYSMVSPSGITDWYAYFFEPIERLSDLIVTDIPVYAAPTITVDASDPCEDVAVGALICGFSRSLGGTRWGGKIGIQDYSVKQIDDFGSATIVERAYAKRGTFEVLVPNGLTDQLQTLLAGYRAEAVLYIGDPDYASTAIYGFYRDFEVAIAYPDLSLCTLEIEGLT